jgi:hypothetical protein
MTSTVWPCTCKNNGWTKDTMKGIRMQNEMREACGTTKNKTVQPGSGTY